MKRSRMGTRIGIGGVCAAVARYYVLCQLIPCYVLFFGEHTVVPNPYRVVSAEIAVSTLSKPDILGPTVPAEQGPCLGSPEPFKTCTSGAARPRPSGRGM